jgi:hypothetical protein
MSKENRIGFIIVSLELLESAPDLLTQIGGEVIEGRCADTVGAKRFLLRHPEFDLLAEGEIIPQYTAYFTRQPDGTVERGKIERV